MSTRRGLAAAALLAGLILVGALWQPAGGSRVSVLSPLRPSFAPAPVDVLTSRARAQPVLGARPAASAALDAEPRRPHPLTAAHRRIFRENELIGRLNAAMDLADVGELRRLNERYRREYPEDAHQLQDAYELIADCQQQPTDAARRKAQRFRSEHRGSSLRRYVRRHCLETEES